MKLINHIKKDIYYLVFLTASLITVTGCRKLIDIDSPSNTVDATNVFNSNENAIAVVTGIYTNLSIDNGGMIFTGNGLPYLSVYTSMSADELTLFSGVTHPELTGYYKNNLNANNVESTEFWTKCYRQIFTINAAIDGISESTVISPSIKTQLLGEAHFLRAFFYFYLTNLYGEVPLVLSTDYTLTSLQPKESVGKLYAQMIADLKNARELLHNDYLSGTLGASTTDRVRPNKAAATAMLARVYLYMNDYVNAEKEATIIIDNSTVYDLPAPDAAFIKNSKETIWALQPVGLYTDRNTGEGKVFILPGEGPNEYVNQIYLSDQLIAEFESGDQRYARWTDSVTAFEKTYHYAFKYKIGMVDVPSNEFPVILRTAEQYLIRAEARIKQNNIDGGIADLNSLRRRATDNTAPVDEQLKQLTSALSANAAMNAVVHERRVELFTEWGHRWFDIRRTGQIDMIMQAAARKKGSSWDSHSALYPIPVKQIINNPNLKQNEGY